MLILSDATMLILSVRQQGPSACGKASPFTIHRYDGATGSDRRERFASVRHRQAGLTAKTGGAARAGRRGRRPHRDRARRSSNSAEVDISHVMLSALINPARGIRYARQAHGAGRSRMPRGKGDSALGKVLTVP